jgi:membrane associated rhomboid family serine protease
MKFVLSYLFMTSVFLFIYYVVLALASIASYLTDGVSTYVILIALAAISGLLGPLLLNSDEQ